MAGEGIVVTEDVLKLVEAELSSGPAGGIVPTAPGPDIPARREQLAVLVSTGKAKDAIGVQLTHEQVKRLSDKDVEKYTKCYQTYVGSKTTESLIDSFIFLATKAVRMKLKIKDIGAYQKELRNDYILNKELSNLAGNLALKCGWFLAVANAAVITTKHIDFNLHLERKDEAKLEEIPQSSTTAEGLQTNNFQTFFYLLSIHICFKMSTEQSETAPAVTAHSQGETHTAPTVNITQQATTPTATTTTLRTKNPKCVAARKMVAERTWLAREQQKKAAEAYNANNKAKATAAAPEPAPTTEYESPKSSGEKNCMLSTTQWLTVGSIVISLVGIYYKCEELKVVFGKKTPEPARVEPEPARATQPKVLRQMD